MITWLRDKTRPLRRRLAIRNWVAELKFFIDLQRGKRKRAAIDCPVIGITGSSGKSSTANLVEHVLAQEDRVQAQVIENTFGPLVRFLAAIDKNCRFVVAELGASVPGSISAMVNHLKPTVAVVTKVGLEHYTAFRTKAAVAGEKGAVVAVLPESGLAILNADDPHVAAMASLTKARVVTFGWSQNADYRVLEASDGLPSRMSLKIRCATGVYTIQTPFIDESFWLATAAAFACTVELGLAPEAVARSIGTAVPIWNRLQPLEIDDGPCFVIDSAKAPSESLEPTIALLRKASAPDKTFILGSISDYSGNPRKQYRNAYNLGRAAADRVMFVGDHVHRAPATDEERRNGTYTGCRTVREASEHIRSTARRGELILIKGSRNLHLERIALSWTMPVRCWEPACGKSIDCLRCGMIGVPYEQHGAFHRAERWARLRFWKRFLA